MSGCKAASLRKDPCSRSATRSPAQTSVLLALLAAAWRAEAPLPVGRCGTGGRGRRGVVRRLAAVAAAVQHVGEVPRQSGEQLAAAVGAGGHGGAPGCQRAQTPSPHAAGRRARIARARGDPRASLSAGSRIREAVQQETVAASAAGERGGHWALRSAQLRGSRGRTVTRGRSPGGRLIRDAGLESSWRRGFRGDTNDAPVFPGGRGRWQRAPPRPARNTRSSSDDQLPPVAGTGNAAGSLWRALSCIGMSTRLGDGNRGAVSWMLCKCAGGFGLASPACCAGRMCRGSLNGFSRQSGQC